MSLISIRKFWGMVILVGLLAAPFPAESQVFNFWNKKTAPESKKPIYNTTRPPRALEAEAPEVRSRAEMIKRARAMRSGQSKQMNQMRQETNMKLAALDAQQNQQAALNEAKEKNAQVRQNYNPQSPAQGSTTKKVIYNKPGSNLTKPPKVFTDYR
jgi:hypothetical protein